MLVELVRDLNGFTNLCSIDSLFLMGISTPFSERRTYFQHSSPEHFRLLADPCDEIIILVFQIICLLLGSCTWSRTCIIRQGLWCLVLLRGVKMLTHWSLSPVLLFLMINAWLATITTFWCNFIFLCTTVLGRAYSRWTPERVCPARCCWSGVAGGDDLSIEQQLWMLCVIHCKNDWWRAENLVWKFSKQSRRLLSID